MTNVSVERVRQILKPAEELSRAQILPRPQVQLRKTFDAKPTSIFLRRTSSALMTKYSRKFVSNLHIRAKTINQPTTYTQRVPNNQTLANNRSPVHELTKQRANNDSIYTIGEDAASSVNQANFDNSSNRRSGSLESQEQAKPSYCEPTHSHRKHSKDINRVQMTKAIEAMRKAQLK